MATSMLMIISTLLLIFGARALILDPVGLVYAPDSIGKRQAFTGTLGASAPLVTNTGDSERPYGVDGDTFLQQPIRLLPEANTDQSSSFSLQDCQDQLSSCMSTVSSTNIAAQGATIASAPTASSSTTDATTVTAQLAQTTIPYDSEYDLVCDL
ncbi:hypothetical protein BDV24DRAFT_168774 [Aspergillus arachidicola]|uniref:Uncharacterized protein n=1 Tax=Aspergillus arachidicola TaxID=656916 RepID=A0A2G7FHK5_9EURO|nr:hypothetical protein BDV24DRAFT_168774 [Aspergillus arachidicola]PIG80107.1 hypothetical protein AARAC_010672 [Aspergillus arachidicola]